MIIDDTCSKFHMSLHLYFTCSFMRISRAFWVVVFLDLDLQKMAYFYNSRCDCGHAFCDHHTVIVDHELQVPVLNINKYIANG